MSLRSDIKTNLLSIIRQGAPVTWTPDWMGFGNVLYLYLNAWNERALGSNRRVLETPGMQTWLETFPRFRSSGLVISRPEVKLTSQRDRPWETDPGSEAYTLDQREDFIRDFMLSAPLFDKAPRGGGQALDDPESLTVNVRRGDYYSVPEFEKLFGFDQIAYLRDAVFRSVEQTEKTSRIHLVSDDIAWCKQHLAWLSEFTNTVTYAASTDSPQRNMLDVASSRRLVMTNSTFSYWCGYISSVLYEDNHKEIIAPRFFARFEGTDGKSNQLDPRWTIVEEIPGGWDRPY